MSTSDIVLFVLVVTVYSSGVRAEDPDVTPPGERNPIQDIQAARTVYNRSPTLPDGVAFRESASAVTEFAKDDPEFAHALIAQQMGFDEQISTQLLALFRVTLKAIATETQARKKEIGCLDDVPRVFRDNAYLALEQMEDASEAIAESHYLRVKEQVRNQFGEDAAARLQAWIESQKGSIVHVKFDQREFSNNIGIEGDERLERICREFADRSVSGSYDSHEAETFPTCSCNVLDHTSTTCGCINVLL
jgi:hypothetical protein